MQMSQDEPNAADYNDAHRAFLHVLISRQCLTADDARPLLARILAVEQGDQSSDARSASKEELEAYIHAINDKISPYDLEVRSTRHQRTNAETYALVNTTSDALMQMATTHTADEIAFVRRVLDAMFEAYNTLRAEVMAVTIMQALKLAKPTAEDAERRDSGTGGVGAVAALTGVQAEKMMQDMVTEGWFEQTRSKGTQFYVLSPRALLELREWLVDTYNAELDEDADAEEIATFTRIKKCYACKEIVTQGQRCSRQTCLGRLHEHCSARMFRAQGNREVCPVCENAWDLFLPVGVKAAGGTRQANGPSARSGRGNRPSANVQEEDDDEHDDDDD